MSGDFEHPFAYRGELAPPRSRGLPEAVWGLRRGDCRWPHGHPLSADFHFCCEPVASEGSSYCKDHIQGRGGISSDDKRRIEAHREHQCRLAAA